VNDLTHEDAARPSPDCRRLERLLGLLAREPGNLGLRKDVVREACKMDAWERVGEIAEEGACLYPDDTEMLVLSACVHMNGKRYAEAEKALAAAIALGFEPVEVRYHLAFARLMQRRHAQALEILKVPLMSFELPRALILRARCWHHLGRRDEAIKDCRAYLAHASMDAETNGLLAILLYEDNQHSPARRHADAALLRDPLQCEALLTLALIHADGDNDVLARHIFERLLAKHPVCGRGWLGLALLKLRHSQVEEAKRDVELATQYTPDDIATWQVLGWIEIMRGDVTAAQRAFETAHTIDRNFAETHGGLAVVAALQGHEDQARLSVKRALRLDPEALSSRYAEVLLFHRSAGGQAKGREILRKVLERPAPRADMRHLDLVVQHLSRLRFVASTSSLAR
jgi:tetratricopeptide (TPR) repeat protein